MNGRLNDCRDAAVGVRSGRRFCVAPGHLGPRYRPVVDFGVKTWGDLEGTWVASLQSVCAACARGASRRRMAVARGVGGLGSGATYGVRGVARSPAARRAARREKYASMMRLAKMNPLEAYRGGPELEEAAREARAWLARVQRQGREKSRAVTLERGGQPRAVKRVTHDGAGVTGRVYRVPRPRPRLVRSGGGRGVDGGRE